MIRFQWGVKDRPVLPIFAHEYSHSIRFWVELLLEEN
jgi:hypothetical protein